MRTRSSKIRGSEPSTNILSKILNCRGWKVKFSNWQTYTKHCVLISLIFSLLAPPQLLAFTGGEENDFLGMVENQDSDDSFLNDSRMDTSYFLAEGEGSADVNSMMAGDGGFLGSKLETKWKKQEMGATFVKSQQKFNGLEVFGGEVVVRTDNTSVNQMGFLFKDINVDKKPKISKRKAISILKDKFGEESAVSGKLGILPVKSGARLAYRFTVSKNIFEPHAVYLDATTGEILRAFSLVDSFNPSRSMRGGAKISLSSESMNSIHAAEDPCGGGGKNSKDKINVKPQKGSGINLADKRVPFLVAPFTAQEYVLFNVKNNTMIMDAKKEDILGPAKKGEKKKSAEFVLSKDKDNWGDQAKAAVSAHRHIEMFNDFMRDKLKRDSLDGRGGLIRVFVNAIMVKNGRKMVDNASFIPGVNVLLFFPGSWNSKTKTGHFKNWAGALDVAGHEMAHGITANTSCLEYLNESGAINESFSDMMGTAVEYYYDRENFDWANAEDIVSPANKREKGGTRFMDQPKKRGNPDTYKGEYWFSGKQDHGGVHTNSGVGNKAFYLMVEGGEHNGVAVPGLGMDKAVVIAYRANKTYLTKRSQYIDCAKGFILAAKDLYGDEDARKVLLAWKAVKLEVDEKIIGSSKQSSPAPKEKSPDTVTKQKSTPAPEKKPGKPTAPKPAQKKRPAENFDSDDGFLGDL